MPGAILLRGFALPAEDRLLDAIAAIARAAPFRHMQTRGGRAMSVAMTNCGTLGWISDRRGYRYVPIDPGSGRAWPPMPDCFSALAMSTAEAAGFLAFEPDACLVNRYAPGARMTLHQDRDEHDFAQPIVSVSLGLPAVFLLGGHSRSDRPVRLGLEHGDVLVLGGPARLRFHGVMPLRDGEHPALGHCRINLTFRRAK